MKFYVYELRDETGLTFYVGKGSGNRMHAHRAKAVNGERTKKAEKIRSIVRGGGQIIAVKIFSTDDEDDAFRVERELIAFYGRAALTNLTDGGDGPSNPAPEVRARIAAGRRGIIASAATREKQRQRKLGVPRSSETRSKISAYQRGSKHPWATTIALANIAAGMTFEGRTHTPTTIEKMRAAKRGHTVTVATRQKISQSKKGSVPWNKGIRS